MECRNDVKRKRLLSCRFDIRFIRRHQFAKTIRDKNEGIPTSDLYYSISWVALAASLILMVVGLWNAELLLSEKGFYTMSYILSLFAVITIQKNTRDLAAFPDKTPLFFKDEA